MIRHSIISAALLTSGIAFATAGEGEGGEAAEKTNKSIVPNKYAGKYKNGGSDALAAFINDQCKDKDGNFEFTYFFDLCRKNGVKEEQVAKYEGLYADKENNRGIEGRARMTLRNMLAAIVRKEGKVIDRDGDEVEMHLAKPAASGAAAAAQAAASTTGTVTGQGDETEGDDELETEEDGDEDEDLGEDE